MPLPDRIIALEIRASRFGFVVLEGAHRLLDWGVRSFGELSEELDSTVSDRVGTLIVFYRPTTVVIRERQSSSSLHCDKIRTITQAVRSSVRSNSVHFHIMTTSQVRERLGVEKKCSKHEIAKSLADRFEELSFKLPNRRKAYQSEAPAMLVFDALATGVAFLDRNIS